MTLLIVIPAYNEEASIESIIQKTLSAKQYIISHSPVTSVQITVVSDGSTDATAELARRYVPHIKLIAFERNRGYGAAIKEAWSQSRADLLGFLDADGTCDPRFFADLCVSLAQQGADVVLGCRMCKDSRMPLIRRIGNAVFAAMLSVFSTTRVRDTASGMRVVRAEAAARLMPLPDGLHFTPAMSARALLNRETRIVEIDMPYHERQGRSKLNVGKDGMRFLNIILETVFLYRPARPLAIFSATFAIIAIVMIALPFAHYLRWHTVEEWMIYRFILSHLAWTNACLLAGAAYLSGRIVHIALGKDVPPPGLLHSFFSNPCFPYIPIVLMVGGGVLVVPGVLEHLWTGASYEHWSRFLAMSFLFVTAFVLICVRAVDYVVNLISAELAYARNARKQTETELVTVNG